MKPCTSSMVTTRPLTRPMRALTASAATTPTSTLEVWPAMMPPATRLLRLVTNGTDRSRLPARMTRVCPIAMKPSTLMPVSTAERLPGLKKLRPTLAVSIALTTTTMSSTTQTMPVEVTGVRQRVVVPVAAVMRCAPASTAPVATCEHVLLGGPGRQLADEAAVAHDEDAVGHADHLRQLAGDHEDRRRRRAARSRMSS